MKTKQEHQANCPRLQFWDAGEYDAPCTCDMGANPPTWRRKMSEYINCVDTAKLIRKQLKKHLPKIKFAVQSKQYSGGASIRIYWTDGPTVGQVEKHTNAFAGAEFDGMIDMKYNKQSWLHPDGSVSFGSSEGSVCSAGADPGYDNPSPCPSARLVRFGADYIFANRSISDPIWEATGRKIAEDYGNDISQYTPDNFGTVTLVDSSGRRIECLTTLIHRELRDKVLPNA